jgi:hypothetical protein
MNSDFIKLLKEKFFDKGTASVYWQKDYSNQTNGYAFKKYASHGDPAEQFLLELETDLAKPIEKKSFKFTIREMKALKRTTLLSFIKSNKSLEDFENVFHSFYKNFGMDDLFNNFHIKGDFNGQIPKNHPYSPYILFLLKQDFTSNQSFSPDNFMKALSFNFKSNENNYVDLKESLYAFLNTHYEKAKEQNAGSYLKEERNRSFDLQVYERIKKHIRENDLVGYSKFWKSILIKEQSQDLFTVPKEEFFVFNIQHAYLTNNYSSLTNSEYAKSACEFVGNFFNSNLKEYLNITLIKQEDSFTRFVCEFKQPTFKKENLQHFINSALKLHEDCNLIQTNYLRNEYRAKYEEGIAKMRKELTYFVLDNTVPTKDVIKTKVSKI